MTHTKEFDIAIKHLPQGNITPGVIEAMKEYSIEQKQRIEALEASLKDIILIAEYGKTATSEYQIKKAKSLVY